jgi:uncharacterized LabA/DUF88 family protein
MREKNELYLAVLIDADNIPYSNIKGMLDEIAKFGIPTIKRIYGDWTKQTVSGWKPALLEHAITPIQQYSYTTGKNATDSAMIIDAMDILHSGKVDGFCVVSSDSDFTRLATRLRESGMLVIGIGEKKTPRPFIASCDKFIYIEIIGATSLPKKTAKTKPLRQGSWKVKLILLIIKLSSYLKVLLKILPMMMAGRPWLPSADLSTRKNRISIPGITVITSSHCL